MSFESTISFITTCVEEFCFQFQQGLTILYFQHDFAVEKSDCFPKTNLKTSMFFHLNNAVVIVNEENVV